MKRIATVQAMLFAVGLPFLVGSFSPVVRAQNAGFLRFISANGTTIRGESKDPAHLNWIPIASVAAAGLNNGGQADRESSSPSVSEVAPRQVQKSQASAHRVSPVVHPIGTPGDSSSGAATGRRSHQPFVVTKQMDSASPKLYEACASGQHFKEVDVDLVSTGVHYKLFDVLIASDRKAGGAKTMETIELSYGKIEWTK